MAKDDLPPSIEVAAFVPGHLTVDTMLSLSALRRRLGRSGQPEEVPRRCCFYRRRRRM
jgi:hypothetical protein